jgi:dihydrodipicolinate synthase/N-acetylneuraminate lyase
LTSPLILKSERVNFNYNGKGCLLVKRHIKALDILRNGTAIPASPLVLDENRKFDEKRQRALFRYYLHAGAGGLAVGVHTTQFEIRDKDINLFEPILDIAIEEIDRFEKQNNKTVVRIAGTCGPMQQAIKEAEMAKALGYDAVLLSPGGLPSLGEDEMLERTKAVAGIIPVIGFYLQPAVGGRRFSFNYWERFCEIPWVAAIKSAPFDRYMTLDVVRAAALSSRNEEIALYTGNDDNILVDLLTTYEFSSNGKTYKKRFVGGLLGHWAVWTKTSVEIYKQVKRAAETEKIPAELLTLAAQVTDANAAFFDTANDFKGCIAGLHEVLRRQGLMEGIWCLNPRETLSPGQMEEIDRVYATYPHLNDDEFVKQNIDKWLE